MDVNKTVQANKLARELVKYGLVSSIDEGVSKATAMVKEGFDYTPDPAVAVQSASAQPSQAAQVQMPQQQQMSHQTGNYEPSEVSTQSGEARLFERKLNYLAKSFADQFNKEMGEVRKQIDSINNEMRNIRDQMAAARRQASQSQEPQQRLSSDSSASAPPKKRRDDEPIKPRTGDLTPDDIDLDSYFYFGSGGSKKR
jgi:hypothetical protein